MKILVLNGPNLNLLGLREPEIYGKETYRELCRRVKAAARAKGIGCKCIQSNYEGDLVTAIQKARGKYDGILFNPAGYTHTSVAILDAVKAAAIPTVEVHLSDPDCREDFRKISYVREAAIATVKGEGIDGYLHALEILEAHLQK